MEGTTILSPPFLIGSHRTSTRGPVPSWERSIMFRKYACVRQRDMADCGAAALATIALHYRRPIGLEQMRDLAGTDRFGTNLLGLLKAAEKLGFSAKGVKGSYEALTQVPLPAIAHLKTDEGLGHFV